MLKSKIILSIFLDYEISQFGSASFWEQHLKYEITSL